MKRSALLLLLGLCTACGSYKAVRPDAPRAVVVEAQNNAIRYQAADGSRISAIYVNSNSPMTVELHQGSTASTIWQLQDGFATLTRGGKTVVFTEIIE